MGRRPKPKPNYDLLFKSAVYELQMKYADYKKAVAESLKWTFYDDEGNFCILSGWAERNEKIVSLEKQITVANAEVEKYRRLREGEQNVSESHP